MEYRPPVLKWSSTITRSRQDGRARPGAPGPPASRCAGSRARPTGRFSASARPPAALRQQQAVGQERRVPALGQHLGTAGGEVGGVGDDRALGVIADVIRCGVAEHRIEPDQQILGSAGQKTCMPGMPRMSATSSMAWWVGPLASERKPGKLPTSLTGRPGMPTSVRMNSKARSVRKARQRVDDRDAAAQRQARRHPDHGLLADPDVDEARAQPLGQGPDRGPVLGGHDHDALVLFGETVQGVFVAGQSELAGLRTSHVPMVSPIPSQHARSQDRVIC